MPIHSSVTLFPPQHRSLQYYAVHAYAAVRSLQGHPGRALPPSPSWLITARRPLLLRHRHAL
ncbi:hypothetical protein BAUCODRAFT_332733 [Baudoinia panamericana UAMH 10762]|uniref:Uncharacterized protein n=1 Tax=Baudoinia panamericana (strain UAMH 10762) TaxID=717646 RepID=M2MI81_BAUPA|nr:uncharacterized protein BAUCODRAFT_332733 [Baudoinia panamericana UAMH 10762]EMC90978.1 hypothetical protein BAUCODRAFT_332733 [Baudoinia panamericana UAMH 10762]